jgi:hypothetical protein
MKKKYRTRDGRAVVFTDYQPTKHYPIRGKIEGSQHAEQAWTTDGFFYMSRSECRADLIEVEQENEVTKLDLTKDVQTKDGRPVTILSTKGRGDYPVVGYVGDNPMLVLWSKEGKCMNSVSSSGSSDLVNPPAKFVRYINVYEGGSAEMHTSRERADTLASRTSATRILCKRVDMTEGEFSE